jgi:hypothetical protein
MLGLTKFFDTCRARNKWLCIIQCCVTVDNADDLKDMYNTQPLLTDSEKTSESGGKTHRRAHSY